MRTATRLLDRLMDMVGTGFGLRALECVELPRQLAFAPSARSRRLVRNARVSAW